MKFENILIIRPDAIGDCVLITPAITALKKRFPKAKISILAQELTKDLFTTNPHIHEVIIDANDIRSRNFDLAIHYFNEMPYALATLKAGIKYRLGNPSKFPVGWLYNIKAPQNWRDIFKHDVEQNMLLLKPLGINPPYPKLDIHVDKEALRKVDKLLKENGISPNDKIAGFHLSTGKGNKPWSPENFRIIADYLTNKGFKIVASGREKDKELIQKAASNNILDLSMQTSLKELIALTSKYSLFMSVDTGPYHIAAALGIPMLHISTSKFSLPLRWGPWKNRHVVIRKRSSCKLFCLPANCKENICAEEITPDEVKEAIETLLAGGGNKTQEEARFDWCRKSFSIMITYKHIHHKRAEQIHKVLERQGFYSIFINIDKKHDYQRLFKENNTNILHAVDHSLGVRFQALISGKSLILPVLYVKENPKLSKFEEFYNLYRESFEKSRV